MIDRHLTRLIAPLFTRLAAVITARVNVSANAVTFASFFLGVVAFVLLWQAQYLAALVFILANRIGDGLDGYMARARDANGSTAGAFLDISLDFVFYALAALGFALSNPAFATPGLVLLASFIGTGTSFLAFASIAARLNMTSTAFPKKGIYYLGGITEGFETIVFFVIACLWPAAFPVLAYLFAGLCAATTAMRIYYGYQTFIKH